MIQVKVTYISTKPPLLVEHAIPLKGFVVLSAHITFCDSHAIMLTAGPELPYPCFSRPSLGSSLLGLENNVTVVVSCITCWFNILGVRLDVICKLETL